MIKAVLPPGVLSLHVLPADHHDRDWDNIVVPRKVTHGPEYTAIQFVYLFLPGRQNG